MARADFLYYAWFVDPTLPEDDQDREWVACFIVRAETAEEAQAWGDQLARAKADRSGEPFLSSGVEPSGEDSVGLPVIIAGFNFQDEDLGW